MEVLNIEDVRREQKRHLTPECLEKDAEDVYKRGNRIWIRTEAKHLKFRIIVGAHFGES